MTAVKDEGLNKFEITVKLTQVKPVVNDDPLVTRILTFDQLGQIIPLGRSSSTLHKNLVPATNNGWFACPVISRNHANLVAVKGLRGVEIALEDNESSHGTFVNDHMLDRDVKYHLRTGDRLRLGIDVTQESTTHISPTYLVAVHNAQIPLPQVSTDQPSSVTLVDSPAALKPAISQVTDREYYGYSSADPSSSEDEEDMCIEETFDDEDEAEEDDDDREDSVIDEQEDHTAEEQDEDVLDGFDEVEIPEAQQAESRFNFDSIFDGEDEGNDHSDPASGVMSDAVGMYALEQDSDIGTTRPNVTLGAIFKKVETDPVEEEIRNLEPQHSRSCDDSQPPPFRAYLSHMQRSQAAAAAIPAADKPKVNAENCQSRINWCGDLYANPPSPFLNRYTDGPFALHAVKPELRHRTTLDLGDSNGARTQEHMSIHRFINGDSTNLPELDGQRSLAHPPTALPNSTTVLKPTKRGFTEAFDSECGTPFAMLEKFDRIVHQADESELDSGFSEGASSPDPVVDDSKRNVDFDIAVTEAVPQPVTVIAVPAPARPAKRARLSSFMAGVAVGAAAGSVGLLGTLMALPEGFFA